MSGSTYPNTKCPKPRTTNPPATQRARQPTASARNSPRTRAAKRRASAEAASSPPTTLSETSTANPSPPNTRFVAAHATTRAPSTPATSTLLLPLRELDKLGGSTVTLSREWPLAPTEPPLRSSAPFKKGDQSVVSLLYIRRMTRWRSVRQWVEGCPGIHARELL